MKTRVGAIGSALLLALVSVGVVGQTATQRSLASSQADRPWPAPVHAVSDAATPPLEPAEALKTIHMAPGYRLELVAAEPLVRDPILMEFDGDGRLWVMEMNGFAINEKMENSFEPINSLVILEDTDRDGRFDKRNVFLDKLVMPRAFKILDKTCALVGEPPNLWKACDTSGDLRSDTKEMIADNFSKLGVVEHGANGLYWGMDNLIRVAEHDWDVSFRGGQFARQPGLSRGQWGITQDDAGRIYRNVNTDPLYVDYLPARYYLRNPHLVGTSGLYESLVRQEDSMVWPVRPTLGLNRGYRRDVFRKDGSATYYGGVSSPMIYRGTRLPKELHGQPFVVDGPTNLVHLLSLKNDAGSLSATDYYKRGEFLASTDERFRPVALTTGWDGTIYLADMYRGVSQDGPLQTDYLKDYIGKRKLWQSINRGRIYRVVRDGMAFDGRPTMSTDTAAELVAHLAHPNGWWRDTAQQLLVQRNDRSTVPALRRLTAASDYRTRLHALWTLDGMGAIDWKTVRSGLSDASPEVRTSAIRLSERFIGGQGRAVHKALMGLSADPDRHVRIQLTATLGELAPDMRLPAIVALLAAHGDDRIFVDAAVSGLAGQERMALERLAALTPRPAAVTMLAAAIGKSRDAASAQALLAIADDATRTEPLRLAVLDGLAMGLRGGAASEGVVAGNRAGPGVAGAGRREVAGVKLSLDAKPAALGRLEGSKPFGASAKQVAAYIGWPGKPAPPAVPPRTGAEETLFVNGAALYSDNCSACHMASGRGGGTLGADLAGSRFVTAIGSVPVRILNHGKEGKLGLMPPLGAAMSDDDIAAILTYIRGSWGNQASPILPLAVKEWRQAYAHRQIPWTEPELLALAR